MPSHGTTSSGHCRHHLCCLSGLDGQLLYSRMNTDTEIEGPASAKVSENLPDFNLFVFTHPIFTHFIDNQLWQGNQWILTTWRCRERLEAENTLKHLTARHHVKFVCAFGRHLADRQGSSWPRPSCWLKHTFQLFVFMHFQCHLFSIFSPENMLHGREEHDGSKELMQINCINYKSQNDKWLLSCNEKFQRTQSSAVSLMPCYLRQR